MDWLSISRFAPEVSVLAVGGYFSLKAIGVFRDILNKMEKQNNKTFDKLSKAIDRNTQSTTELIKSSKEHNDFMRHLNGKLEKAVQKTAKENE